MAFKINGRTIKNPSDFDIARYKITEAERLANGSMTMELIARKLKFFFTYDVISQNELDVIIEELWDSDSCFHELTYEYKGAVLTKTVYVGEIPSKLHRNDGTNTVWKDVNFNLIEK